MLHSLDQLSIGRHSLILVLARIAMAPALIAVALVSALIAGKPAIEGYSDFAALTSELNDLAKSENCDVKSLAKSPGDRDVWLVTVGRGEVDKKPAILVLGNVEAPHLLGSE
jgi:CO dehydrogenase/acetyl-CoA synthase alpha subunit